MKAEKHRNKLTSLFVASKRRIRFALDGLRGRTASKLKQLNGRIENLNKKVLNLTGRIQELNGTNKELSAKNAKLGRELAAARKAAEKSAIAADEFRRKARRLEKKLHVAKYPFDPAIPDNPALALLERTLDKRIVLTAPEGDDETRRFRKLVDDVFRFLRRNRQSDLTAFLQCLVPTRHGDFTRNALEQTEILLRLIGKVPARAYAYSLMDTPGMEKTGRACMVKVALSEKKVPFAHSLCQSLGEDHVMAYLSVEWIHILARTEPREFPVHAARLFAQQPRNKGFEFYFSLARHSYTSGDAVLALRILAWLETGGLPDEHRQVFHNFREAVSQLIHARIQRESAPSAGDSGAIRIGLLDYKNPDYARISRNIGDYIQSLAFLGNLVDAGVRNHCNWGLAARDILNAAATRHTRLANLSFESADSRRTIEIDRLDRDFMSAGTRAAKTWVIVYGWFMQPQFNAVFDIPFPDNLRPVFVSFHVNKPEMLTPPVLEYLRAHGPVGCRDWATVCLLRSHGIDAFFSGCMTMTLNKLYGDQTRGPVTAERMALVDEPQDADADSSTAGGAFEVIEQEYDAVRDQDFLVNLKQAQQLLDRYRFEFSGVRTSRLHCYLPCRALGVPVEFVSKPGRKSDVRFEGLIGEDQATFEATRDGLQDKLARLLDLIIAGHPDDEVYRNWREICQPDLQKAEQYCSLQTLEVPTFEGVPGLVAKILEGRRTVGPEVMETSSRRVEVSIALDQGHLAILPNVLRSIVAHTRSAIRFHLLTRGLTSDDLLPCKSCVDGHAIIIYPMDEVDYGEGLRTTDHITVSTMDRLLLPHILEDLDKVVYLDTDILVRADVRELFDLDLDDLPLAGRSSLSQTWKIGHHLVYRVARGLSARASSTFRRLMHGMHGSLEFPCFNAGVLVLNLDRMRRDDFCRRFLTWADVFQLNDQDILNCYCGNRRGELPASWNTFPNQEVLEDPSLVHWAGPLKPWSANHALYKNEWLEYSLVPAESAPRATGDAMPGDPGGKLIPLHLGKRRFYLNPESMKLEAVQQQLSTYSLPARHPVLLENLKHHVAQLGLPGDFSILSYGCSEGFECMDLRRMFPEARISGCDINREALDRARERCPDDINLFFSNDGNLSANGPYDVVIAFNVFCCYPETAGLDDIAALYPLRTMENALLKLFNQLGQGGILGVYNSPYFIESCGSLSARVSPLPDAVETANGWIEKCGPAGDRISDVTFQFEGRSYSRAEWADAQRSPAFRDRGIHPDFEGVRHVHTSRTGDALPGSLNTTFWLKGPA